MLLKLTPDSKTNRYAYDLSEGPPKFPKTVRELRDAVVLAFPTVQVVESDGFLIARFTEEPLTAGWPDERRRLWDGERRAAICRCFNCDVERLHDPSDPPGPSEEERLAELEAIARLPRAVVVRRKPKKK